MAFEAPYCRCGHAWEDHLVGPAGTECHGDDDCECGAYQAREEE